ncbi:5-formyltetrahydrofolate cyclo-ligase [Blattabacterium cuenoti]|uniref:5-formyltetrahydrofolate cyclo-ligase n=1 Tax=Blattabacterium cuenoti TaxID=1653831 RepID=UPI00163B90E6|nr:5-formyltetrahydrofolate cyclo-ligase [Blattabacterium cuenoti]
MKLFKKVIRKIYLQKRFFLSKKNIDNLSFKIFFQIKKISIWDKKYYHIFLPIKKFNEVNTLIIVNFLLKINKYITVPVSNFNNNSINNCLFIKKNYIKKNKYGILEPKNKIFIPPIFIDVIFIPLLMFDFNGYRVGYGKGFYDNFLQSCNNNVIKIGLNFFNPKYFIKDINNNDLRLDIGVTPNNILFFNNLIEKKFKNIPYNNSNHH